MCQKYPEITLLDYLNFFCIISSKSCIKTSLLLKYFFSKHTELAKSEKIQFSVFQLLN